jgi:hypothetical protein
VIRFVLETFKQTKDVIYPIYREIKEIFPEDVYPKLLKSEACFVFNNGSTILLGGANPDAIEGNRGPRCDFLFLDEVCSYSEKDYDYLTKGVLYPQLTTSKFRKIIMTSTPARNPQHPWVVFDYPRIKARNNLMTFTVYENPLLTLDIIENIIENQYYGNPKDPNFLREYMCHLIVDESARVIAEFKADKHIFSGDLDEQLKDVEGVSKHWQGIIACDLGVTDLTGIVGIIVNTYTQKAVVCYERTLHGNTLGEFAKEYLDLYTIMSTKCENIISICDCFEQSMITLRRDYKLDFQRPLKRSVEDNVAVAKNLFSRDKIIIHDSCKYLITQLINGMWDEKKLVNKDFTRSPIIELSHLDHLVSLCYGLRKVHFNGPATKQLPFGFKRK